MRIPIIFAIILFLDSGILLAQTSVSIEKTDEPANPYKKILIISLNNIYENRITIESEITWWVNDSGYNAYPYNKFSTSHDLPNKDLIKDLVIKEGFDALLESYIKDVQLKERYENTQQKYNINPMTPNFYNYFDAYNNAYNMGYSYNTKSYIIETNLVDLNMEKSVFKVTSNTYESIDLEKAIESYARALAKALKKSKLLSKKAK